MLREILPGVFHWSVVWPGWWSLESYFLRTPAGSVLVDPIEFTGLEPVDSALDIRAIVLTDGWHERSARLFAKRAKAPIYVPVADADRFEDFDRFHTYDDGDRLPCDLHAVGVPGVIPGEQALLSPVHGGTLFVGDALGTTGKWAPGGMVLGGHPKGHPVPAQTLSHLLDLQFANLLPGHGPPLIGDGKLRLQELIQSGVSTSTSTPR